MPRIDSYPTGTPTGTDRVPYIADPGGSPALRLTTVSGLPSGLRIAGNTAASTTVLIVTGQVETIAVTLTATVGAAALVAGSLSLSMNDYGHAKTVVVRLRQTDVSGAILWSAAWTPPSDSVTGDAATFQPFIVDEAPAGTWVITVEATAGSAGTQIWSARRSLVVLG